MCLNDTYVGYEDQYMKILSDIFYNGYTDGVNERTGHATKRLPCVSMRIDVEKEFPILRSKFVAAKTALREIEWIWKQQSNNINDLKAHIWDEWADETGSIGKAYGYQIGQPIEIFADPVHHDKYRTYKSQAHYIIEYLKEFPQGRWGVATLWNPKELKDMHLVPCCHTSTWNLDGGRLNCVLDQRSGDFPYGVPFNTTQYAELMCMFAKELNVKPGILLHTIADAHIYDNQMDGVCLQILLYRLMTQRKSELDTAEYTEYFDEIPVSHSSRELAMNIYCGYANRSGFSFSSPDELLDRALYVVRGPGDPTFSINTEKSFFDYGAESCSIDNYRYMCKINFGDVVV